MRRALAITLLIALFAPAFAPPLLALTADPEAGLPACCRSHGAHHCAMLHWHLSHDTETPTFAPAPCVSYPTVASGIQSAVFAFVDPPHLSVAMVPAHELVAATALRAQLVLALSRRDRGPPVLSA